jgi:hypothetical protein
LSNLGVLPGHTVTRKLSVSLCVYVRRFICDTSIHLRDHHQNTQRLSKANANCSLNLYNQEFIQNPVFIF